MISIKLILAQIFFLQIINNLNSFGQNQNYSITLNTSYFSIPNSNSLFSNLNEFTIESWIKNTGNNLDECNKTIIGNYGNLFQNNQIHHFGFNFKINCNRNLEFQYPEEINNVSTLQSIVSTDTISYDWTHVAVVYKYGAFILYINGIIDKVKLIQPLSIYATFQQILDINIGKRTLTANEYFNGNLDEIKIYNLGKSNEEILQHSSKNCVNNIDNTGLLIWFDCNDFETIENENILKCKNNSNYNSKVMGEFSIEEGPILYVKTFTVNNQDFENIQDAINYADSITSKEVKLNCDSICQSFILKTGVILNLNNKSLTIE
ncbi:MAG: LamG domain-containing protein [Bacteroidota bacterium]